MRLSLCDSPICGVIERNFPLQLDTFIVKFFEWLCFRASNKVIAHVKIMCWKIISFDMEILWIMWKIPLISTYTIYQTPRQLQIPIKVKSQDRKKYCITEQMLHLSQLILNETKWKNTVKYKRKNFYLFTPKTLHRTVFFFI